MKKTLFITLGVIFSAPNFLYAEEIKIHDASETNEAQQKFQGFNLEGYKENGTKAWEVNGDTADIQGSQIELSNVNANAYGQEKVNVTADKGTIDQTSGKMKLKKDVIITSESGAQLSTDSLDWDRNKNTVTTKDDVTITQKDMTVTGTGMTAKTDIKNAEIHRDVTLRVDTDPKPDVSKILMITSDGPMEIDQAKSMATFEKNVVAQQEGRTLKADRMEIYFDQDQKKIKELICIGHVEIVQGENKTYSEKAVYRQADQKLTLYGRPKIIMVTEGENAITSFGDKKSD